MPNVLITGAARGIGAELARQLAARGHRLALVGLEPERLAALRDALGPAHAWAGCDVTDQPSLDRAVAACAEALGGIDVVVANAGIASFGTVAATPPDAMARVIDVNVTGVIRTVSATLAHVRARRGYYLLVSSAAAIAAPPGLAAYAASKSAVEHFANCLRLELAGDGVGVGSAHPCWIDTDLVRDPRAELPSFEAMLAQLPPPFNAVTSVEECARALADAIERRRRRVYVPASLGPFAAMRQLLTSALAERLVARRVRPLLEQQEREVKALGRTFGRNTVGAG